MDESRWPLTLGTIRREEARAAEALRDDEDLTLGYSMLRALAESDVTMVEVEPGMWRVRKDQGESAL